MRRFLNRMWSGGLKTAVIAAVVALLVAATTVVAGVPLLKKKSYKENEGIFASYRNGPVALADEPTRIAALEVAAGKYAINAKLYTEFVSEPDTVVNTVTCRLNAGDSVDTTKAVQDARFQPFAMQLTYRFGVDSTVEVRCGDGAANPNRIDAHSIKITAVRARKLVNTESQ
jgi:hypothetical protein